MDRRNRPHAGRRHRDRGRRIDLASRLRVRVRNLFDPEPARVLHHRERDPLHRDVGLHDRADPARSATTGMARRREGDGRVLRDRVGSGVRRPDEHRRIHRGRVPRSDVVPRAALRASGIRDPGHHARPSAPVAMAALGDPGVPCGMVRRHRRPWRAHGLVPLLLRQRRGRRRLSATRRLHRRTRVGAARCVPGR